MLFTCAFLFYLFSDSEKTDSEDNKSNSTWKK